MTNQIKNETPTDLLTIISEINQAASDLIRLNVLRILRFESLGVLELCSIFDLSQSRMSHHLKVLLKASLVATKREGNSCFYRRSTITQDDLFKDLKSNIFELVDRTPLSSKTKKKLEEVHTRREESSKLFFTKNADKFQKKQALIVDFSRYRHTVKELIQTFNFSENSLALELGPGEGELLIDLSPHFKKIYAIDSSQAMLEKAKTNTAHNGIQNISFYQGDCSLALNENMRSHFVALNMVLHHIPSPMRLFYDVNKILEPGGILLLVELCPHSQMWAKEVFGDIWLGFDPRDLITWAESSGLNEEQSMYLGMKNGFQIQIRIFKKLCKK